MRKKVLIKDKKVYFVDDATKKKAVADSGENVTAKLEKLERKIDKLERNATRGELDNMVDALKGIQNQGNGGVTRIASPEAPPKF